MDKDKIKKSKKADLERHRGTFMLMGVVLGLSILFFAFEWSSSLTKMDESVVVQDVVAEEEIAIVRREPTPPPPPPPPEPETPDEIEVVEEKVETVFKIEVEDDQSQRQTEIYVPPPPPVEEEPVEDEIFQVVEERPEFPGGEAELMKYLNKNINYPVIAQENGIQGRVICNFVVEKDGSITDVQVVRGVDPSIDREAVRVITGMPRWKPGKQRKQPVRVRFTLPIVFRLQN